jgi:hypothetical protein
MKSILDYGLWILNSLDCFLLIQNLLARICNPCLVAVHCHGLTNPRQRVYRVMSSEVETSVCRIADSST